MRKSLEETWAYLESAGEEPLHLHLRASTAVDLMPTGVVLP